MEETTQPQPPITTLESYRAEQAAPKTTFEQLLKADTDLRSLLAELDQLEGNPPASEASDLSDQGLRALIADVADLAEIAISRVADLRADLKQL